jgi:hypothetical protein
MSVESVVARVQQIVAAEQQLPLAAHPAAAAAAAAVTATPASGSSTSFADTLAAAQGQPASGIGAAATPAAGVAGAVIPQTSWNPQHKPIASWIVPILQWASEHGWTGTVTSGYRTYSEQSALNASGVYSAPAGKSNHETTQYPGGAVDVTNPSQLLDVLRGYPGSQKLIGGVLGAVDPEHFSATGH